MLLTKVLDNSSSLIAGIVVHDQDFPIDRIWECRTGDALKSLGQALTTVISAQNDCEFHFGGMVSSTGACIYFG